MNWFWKRFAKWQQKRDKGNKPDLIYAFTDSEGNRYYTWQDGEMMPVCRLQALQNLVMHYEMHLAPREIVNVAQAIQNSVADTIKAKTDKERSLTAAKTNAYANELLIRQEYCVPTEIYIEMAAVYAVRHDENAEELSKVIQNEKIAQFTADINAGVDFFFRLPQLVLSTNLSKMSSAQLKLYFQKAAAQNLNHEAVMKYLSSDK